MQARFAKCAYFTSNETTFSIVIAGFGVQIKCDVATRPSLVGGGMQFDGLPPMCAPPGMIILFAVKVDERAGASVGNAGGLPIAGESKHWMEGKSPTQPNWFDATDM